MNTSTLSPGLPGASASDEVDQQVVGGAPSLRRLKNLAAIGSVLADHGFVADLSKDGGALMVNLTSGNTLVVTHNQERGHFIFTVEVITLVDVGWSDQELADLHGKMLSANVQLQPFALAFIPDTDGDKEDDSVYCLVNGVSDKDFSVAELLGQVRDLELAIKTTDGLLSACGW